MLPVLWGGGINATQLASWHLHPPPPPSQLHGLPWVQSLLYGPSHDVGQLGMSTPTCLGMYVDVPVIIFLGACVGAHTLLVPSGHPQSSTKYSMYCRDMVDGQGSVGLQMQAFWHALLVQSSGIKVCRGGHVLPPYWGAVSTLLSLLRVHSPSVLLHLL